MIINQKINLKINEFNDFLYLILHNLLIHGFEFFSGIYLTSKKLKTTKKTSSKSTVKKSSKTTDKKQKNENIVAEDTGIVIIDDDIKIDKDAEIEARRAYLEEAKSQESSSSD